MNDKHIWKIFKSTSARNSTLLTWVTFVIINDLFFYQLIKWFVNTWQIFNFQRKIVKQFFSGRNFLAMLTNCFIFSSILACQKSVLDSKPSVTTQNNLSTTEKLIESGSKNSYKTAKTSSITMKGTVLTIYCT